VLFHSPLSLSLSLSLSHSHISLSRYLTLSLSLTLTLSLSLSHSLTLSLSPSLTLSLSHSLLFHSLTLSLLPLSFQSLSHSFSLHCSFTALDLFDLCQIVTEGCEILRESNIQLKTSKNPQIIYDSIQSSVVGTLIPVLTTFIASKIHHLADRKLSAFAACSGRCTLLSLAQRRPLGEKPNHLLLNSRLFALKPFLIKKSCISNSFARLSSFLFLKFEILLQK